MKDTIPLSQVTKAMRENIKQIAVSPGTNFTELQVHVATLAEVLLKTIGCVDSLAVGDIVAVPKDESSEK